MVRGISGHVEAAKRVVKSKAKGFTPEIALILGSGLGDFADTITCIAKIPYTKIPHFPKGKHVKGHKGELLLGTLHGKKVIVMCGRFHFYQGHTLQEVTFPLRVMHALGAHTLIVTNAAGGLNKKFKVGDLMLIEDHINGMGTNPLIGAHNPQLGAQFVPMTHAYDAQLLALAKKVAKSKKITPQKGVYIALTGPSYETRAEVRMYRQFADAVGMSTVPEVIVANQAQMRVLGISCITNVHSDTAVPTHQEVIDAGKKAAKKFATLVSAIIQQI